ncbi:hypothetical protein [Actinocrispum wychmicini]|uniref:Uncharacterized protein n=1 Tax=Actinocrispum wychmicini TaxID=1213861 RepID=A0A4R2JKQ7_9PSEU|nr:hypothetical protein [Actinocrispum wychmicini]TCO57159.1 hypothetical protein EV192_106636 [Actinocrispum wychmicini]
MTYALGRRPPKDAPALHAGRFLRLDTAPAHPTTVDHLSNIRDWALYANDRFGVCGPAATANLRKQVTKYLTDHETSPTLADVFDLYRRSGNPDFDPATGADDNGVDLQTMLEAVHAGGIGGTTCLGFAKVDVANLDEVRASISIFGSLLLGVNLEVAQQTQTTTGLWDCTPSNVWGGHAVLAGRYSSATRGDDIDVITWAEIIGTTDAFWERQVEEAWVVIWPEHLGTAAFQAGVDVAALASDYLALTGRPFPGHVPPQPAPSPVDPADQVLAAALRPWVTEHHVGANHRVQQAAQAWLAAKGL